MVQPKMALGTLNQLYNFLSFNAFEIKLAAGELLQILAF
jgi:hypothetical protein